MIVCGRFVLSLNPMVPREGAQVGRVPGKFLDLLRQFTLWSPQSWYWSSSVSTMRFSLCISLSFIKSRFVLIFVWQQKSGDPWTSLLQAPCVWRIVLEVTWFLEHHRSHFFIWKKHFLLYCEVYCGKRAASATPLPSKYRKKTFSTRRVWSLLQAPYPDSSLTIALNTALIVHQHDVLTRSTPRRGPQFCISSDGPHLHCPPGWHVRDLPNP